MSYAVEADGLRITGHLALPPAPRTGLPGVVIASGYPSGPDLGAGHRDASRSGRADRQRDGLGRAVGQLPRHRGSAGDFSMAGWLTDLLAAADHLLGEERVNGVWMAGFGTGGASASAPAPVISVCVASRRSRPRRTSRTGRATRDVSCCTRGRSASSTRPATRRRSTSGPTGCGCSARPMRRATSARALLVMHGSDDAWCRCRTPARWAEAHGTADLRIIRGAGHNLRQDPARWPRCSAGSTASAVACRSRTPQAAGPRASIEPGRAAGRRRRARWAPRRHVAR